jgi:hypothetical protein
MHAIIVIIITVVIASITTALADTLTCSTWQGVRTCQGPDGYRSTETEWQGLVIGQDSDSRRWTTSRWRDIETTTVTPPER